MNIQNAVAFITGANRGLGLSLIHALQARGVRKIYAGVREIGSIDLPGVIPVQLDVTDSEQVKAAAAQCGDVDLLINNAGIAQMVPALDGAALASVQAMFDVNVLGIVRMGQAFAPVLAANGGGAMVNILSVASWVNAPALSLYAATKSAAWGITNGLRQSLADQGTLVTGVHVGFMDTDMTRGIEFDKVTPASVAIKIVDAVAAGEKEVLADDITIAVKQGLSSGIYLSALER
ncbi:MAG TPA: SDR family oxidoreductase [Telluria sp.]|nr:SDR family oxidoreductase [Telluria sp.]